MTTAGRRPCLWFTFTGRCTVGDPRFELVAVQTLVHRTRALRLVLVPIDRTLPGFYLPYRCRPGPVAYPVAGLPLRRRRTTGYCGRAYDAGLYNAALTDARTFTGWFSGCTHPPLRACVTDWFQFAMHQPDYAQF